MWILRPGFIKTLKAFKGNIFYEALIHKLDTTQTLIRDTLDTIINMKCLCYIYISCQKLPTELMDRSWSASHKNKNKNYPHAHGSKLQFTTAIKWF